MNLESNPESPERWAEGQIHLGTALRDQGLRTEGAKGTKLLAQAVTAYLRALEVFTCDKFPEQWAETQFHRKRKANPSWLFGRGYGEPGELRAVPAFNFAG